MVAGSVSGLRTENSIAQTSVSHVSLRGDDAPTDSLQLVDVRFGSKADMCSATRYVCFVPKADTVGRLIGVSEI
jgi:hypothetical protein